MIRYYLLTLVLCTIALFLFPMDSFADSFRFVIVQADGQVIVIPGKDFLYMVVTWLGYAGAVFAFGFFLRILRYRVF